MNKKNVLLIDDDVSILDAFEEILTENGYSVDKAQDEKEVLSCLDTQEYHIAIVDIVLKDVNGIKLLENIKASSEGIIIIMITGYPSLETAVESFRLGSCDYLEKPCDKEMLLEAIHKGIEQRKSNLDVSLNEYEEEIDILRKSNVEIKERSRYLERMNKLMVDREFRMIELKKEINELHKELGRGEPYGYMPLDK